MAYLKQQIKLIESLDTMDYKQLERLKKINPFLYQKHKKLVDNRVKKRLDKLKDNS